MIMESFTRQSLVTYALYQEEVSRKRVAATALLYGLELEPGDMVALLDLGDDFVDEVYKVVETTHGVNYAVELMLESILRCSLVAVDSTDPDWIYVVLLMGFEGSDGSQTAPGMNDESGKHHGTADVANFPQIDTAQKKFGTSSLWITGSTPTVIFSGGPDWQLSAANSDTFTVECWVRFDAILGSAGAMNVIVSSSYTNLCWQFGVSVGSTTNELSFGFVPTGAGETMVSTVTSGAALTLNVWHHVAVDKDSTGKIRIYLNGVPKGSSTPANSAFKYDTFRDVLHIGTSGASWMQGWIDELRITKGIARYHTDAGFTSPTHAFPRGGP